MNIQSITNDVNSWDLNDKYLRLKKKSIRKLITLPPKYLGNLNKGIEEAILRSNQEIFNEFDGVPIAMGKKSLLQNVGSSIDDHPFIHFYVDLECIVFSPKVDKKCKATVNKLGETYIGCLICGRINATIFKKDKKTIGMTDAQADAQTVQELNKLSIGQEILIKIKSIQYEQNNNLFIVATFVKAL